MDNLLLAETHYSSHKPDFTQISCVPSVVSVPTNDSGTLAEKLQTTLELPELLDIYARFASEQVNFSSLSFYRPGFRHAVTFSEHAKFAHHFSLNIGKQSLGHLCYNAIAPLPPLQLQQLQKLHQQLIFPLRNGCNYHEVKQKALHDHLTGLGNRASFDEALARLIRQAERSDLNFSLMLLDLDRFKKLNDEWGHNSGDRALKLLSQHIRSCIREADSAYRLGGDEFAILLFHPQEQSAQLVSKRIRHALTGDSLLSKYKVSTSIGATPWYEGDDATSLFKRADKALYRAKAAGRNCLKTA